MIQRLGYILLITITLQSCLQIYQHKQQEYTTDIDCNYSNCITEEPSFGDLIIKFTRNAQQPNPDIYLLSGYWDEQSFIDTFSTDTVPNYRDYIYLTVPLDHYYTVACKYIRDNDTIFAIDGTFITKSTYTLCDSICWQIENNLLNLKLKNFKK